MTEPVKPEILEWPQLYSVYRAAHARNTLVVRGVLRAELDLGHPRVRALLEDWPGTHFSHQTPEGTVLTLVRRQGGRPRERWWLHLLLLAATLLTTTVAGAYFGGREPLASVPLPLGPFALPVPVRLWLPELLPGLAFSLPLVGILFAHEAGHYLLARRHSMDVSPPYFVPAPHWLNLIGTFGAFIRLRSLMINRVMLLDVGAGGPVVSFVLSVPAFWAGIAGSRVLPPPDGGAPGQMVVLFQGYDIWLGHSPLTWLLAQAAGLGDAVLLLGPLAFAGWLGLFVTALNLLPLAQLDGGHILYALSTRAQRFAGYAFLVVLFVIGNPWWGGWPVWWLWILLILVLGRGTIRHPPVFDPTQPLAGRRRAVAWLCIAIFLATFVPRPLFV